MCAPLVRGLLTHQCNRLNGEDRTREQWDAAGGNTGTNSNGLIRRFVRATHASFVAACAGVLQSLEQRASCWNSKTRQVSGCYIPMIKSHDQVGDVFILACAGEQFELCGTEHVWPSGR